MANDKGGDEGGAVWTFGCGGGVEKTVVLDVLGQTL